MWGVIPRRASWFIGYCVTLTGVAFAFSSMTTGCLCLPSPIPAVSAHANGYLWAHGCTSGAMVFEGLSTKSLYSSLRARVWFWARCRVRVRVRVRAGVKATVC